MELEPTTKPEWAEVFRQWGPKLLLFARQQTASVADAEDIVQEAFVRYWKCYCRGLAPMPTAMFGFIQQIAIDHARKSWRRRWWETKAQADREEPIACFECSLEHQERRALIEQGLQSLPQEQREVLVLKIWGELTFEEIGQALRLSPNTAASRYRYGLNQLKKQMTLMVS